MPAMPLDSRRLAATGPPVRVLEDVLVFSGGAGNYDLASNGTFVFFSRALGNLTRDLAWLTVPAGPSDAVGIAPLTDTAGATVARLSANDRLVLVQLGFAGVASLNVYNLERRSMARIPIDADATAAIFGPGQESVTFASNARGLWVASIDGSKPAEQLTTGNHIAGSWSRDGSTLVLTDLTGESGDIRTLRRGDREAAPLIATASDERRPMLSPDDQWLA